MTIPVDVDDCQVVVIGGGPAGACVAGTLAKSGVSVTLFEGKQFPREHIGESLLAMSMRFLKMWGVDDSIADSDFIRKPGAVFRWGGDQREMRLGMPYPGFSYQVSRDRFDDVLLRRAEAAGARVLQGSWVRSLITDDRDRIAGIRVQDGQLVHEVRATYVVDASGLFQFVPKKLGLPMTTEGRQRVAVGCYYAGAGRLPSPSQDDIITEATDNGWIWFIPLSANLTSVGLVTDTDLVGERSPQLVLEHAIAGTEIVRELLKPARTARTARLLRYTNHLVDAPLFDRGYVLVGDSAMFVDPLFSTGVHGALMSASYAAGAIRAVLAGSAEPDLAQWYDTQMRSHYHRVNETVRVLYGLRSGDGEFWKRRDLSDLGDEDAEIIARRLGVTGAAFFAQVMEKNVLKLPETLASRIAEFHTDIRISACDFTAVPRFAPDVAVRHDWVFDEGNVTRGIVAEHRCRRAKTVEYANRSLAMDVLSNVDGRRGIHEITSLLSLSPDETKRATMMVSALCSAGILTLERRKDG